MNRYLVRANYNGGEYRVTILTTDDVNLASLIAILINHTGGFDKNTVEAVDSNDGSIVHRPLSNRR
jgi:hypothetical protein